MLDDPEHWFIDMRNHMSMVGHFENAMKPSDTFRDSRQTQLR